MFRLLFLSLLSGALSPAQAQAPAGPCKPVFDAMLKEATTPHHAVTTRNGVAQGESISVGDAMYVKVKGAWRKSPLSPKQMLAQQQENIGEATTAACTALSDEAVDGTPAAVYHARYEQKDLGTSDSKVWIAKTTGLPLRTDVSMQAGEKVSIVTRFDYDNITAPAVK